jgi:antitoxin HigA-1
MEEFLEPLGVTQHRVAVSIGVPSRRINEIVHGKQRITADTAPRLARYFGTTDRFGLNLETRFDLEVEKTTWGTSSARSSRCVRLDLPRVGRSTMSRGDPLDSRGCCVT